MRTLSLIVGLAAAALLAGGCAGPRRASEFYRDADLIEPDSTAADIGGAAETQTRRAWGEPMGRIDVDRYTLILGHAGPESGFTTVRLEGAARSTTILPFGVADVTFTDDRPPDAQTWSYDAPNRAVHFFRPARDLAPFLRALESADGVAVLMRSLDGGELWAEIRTRTHKPRGASSVVAAHDAP